MQEPKDKRKIIVDKELGKLFTSPLTMFSINAQISKHVKPAGALLAGLLGQGQSLGSGHVAYPVRIRGIHAKVGQGMRFLPLARPCYCMRARGDLMALSQLVFPTCWTVCRDVPATASLHARLSL